MSHGSRLTGLALGAVLACVVTAAPAVGADRLGIRDVNLGGLDAASVWEAAQAVGVTRLEVVVEDDLSCSYLYEGEQKPYRINSKESCAQLSEALQKGKCQIIAFCCVVMFPKGGDDAAQVARIEATAQAAEWLKVPIIMMPLIAQEIDQDEFVRRSTAFLKAVAPFARRHKVQLTVENLGPYLNKPEVLKPLMESVPRNEVALAHDCINMYWFGNPTEKIYELVTMFAPYTRYVHAKNIDYPADKENVQREMGWEYGTYASGAHQGDIDFDRVIGMYLAAGYKGDFTIEEASLGKYDPAGRRKQIMDQAAYLRQAIAKHAASQPAANAAPARPKVRVETSLGDFVIELYSDKAPVTVENFLKYANDQYFDNTIFHRIMADFMIQGGGFVAMGEEKSQGLRPPIVNEAAKGLRNERGTIAMARTRAPNSATSQFFINVVNNAMLDPQPGSAGYCAFGKVVEGMDVVDAIKAVETKPSMMMGGEPSEPINPPIIYRIRQLP